jgi:acetyl esterase/lipase
MSPTRTAPPVDPECGTTWRSVSDALFGGLGPRLDADTLGLARSFELTNRDALLAGRPYDERELQLPGPAGDLPSVFTPDGHAGMAPGLYWAHGGGMVAGSRFGAVEALEAAAGVGAVVVSVEYRLAPATLAGLLLCCPRLDDRMSTVAANQFDDGIPWTRASNEFGWRCLLGERVGTDDVTAYEGPGRATDLTGLPPTLVDVGSVARTLARASA